MAWDLHLHPDMDKIETFVVVDGGGQFLHLLRQGLRTAELVLRDGVIFAVMRRLP